MAKYLFPAGAANPNYKDGHRLSAEHGIWKRMLQRCHDQAHISYVNYGGRGIAVCQRWRVNFEAFLMDMGRRPSAAHSLDRIDNDGPYDPTNCRWATRAEQSRNTSRNVMIRWNGVTKTATDWASETGLRVSAIYYRVKHGWSPERALTTPPMNSGRRRKALRT